MKNESIIKLLKQILLNEYTLLKSNLSFRSLILHTTKWNVTILYTSLRKPITDKKYFDLFFFHMCISISIVFVKMC